MKKFLVVLVCACFFLLVAFLSSRQEHRPTTWQFYRPTTLSAFGGKFEVSALRPQKGAIVPLDCAVFGFYVDGQCRYILLRPHGEFLLPSDPFIRKEMEREARELLALARAQR